MNMNTKEKVKAIEKKLLMFLNKYSENTVKNVKRTKLKKLD
jgi:hypothetical protein